MLKLDSFLQDNKISHSPISIDEGTVQQFIYAIAKKINNRSQARIISDFRRFFDYLIFEDYRATNPTDLLEAPKIEKKSPNTLVEDEINELFKSLRALNFRLSFS